jgi:hypothetical protein
MVWFSGHGKNKMAARMVPISIWKLGTKIRQNSLEIE